jgi:rRNA maturation protein Nop10
MNRKTEVYVACAGCGSDTRIIAIRPHRFSGIKIMTAQIQEDT